MWWNGGPGGIRREFGMFGVAEGRGATRRGSVWWRVAPLPVAVALVWAALTTPSGAAGATVLADWRMDEPAGADVMVDSGPWGLDGHLGTSVRPGVVEQGSTAHRFSTVEPDTSPLDPERLDLVAHDGRLDPGSGDYAMTVRLRTTRPQGNVVQKGQAPSTGGYFKIDMDEGRVACLFMGSAGSVHLRSPASIADGVWHEVRCVRTADEVVLSIDSIVVDRRRGATGTVANTWPVTIAGKSGCNQVSVGCDYFSGDIDRVLLERSGELLAPATSTTSTTVGPSTSTATPTTVRAMSLPTTTVRPVTTTTTVPEVVK
jgi:hypothetical protein